MTTHLSSNLSKFAVAAASICLFSGSLAASEITEQALEKLSSEINVSFKNKNLPEKDFSSWKMLLKNGQLTELRQQVSHYQNFSSSQSVISSLDSELTNLENQKIQRITDSYETNKINVAETLNTAEEPKDLDGLLILLNTASQELVADSSNYSMRKLSQQANKTSQNYRSLIQIVSNWQDYLSKAQQNDVSQALSSLNSIASQVTRMPVLPRSKVLSLQQDLKNRPPQKKPKKLSELNNIEKQFIEGLSAEETLTKLLNTNFSSSEQPKVNRLIAQLHTLKKLNLSPNSSTIEEVARQSNYLNITPEHVKIQLQELYKKVLIKQLVAEFEYPTPHTNHSPDKYLEAAFQHFVNQKNWGKAEQAINYSSLLHQRHDSRRRKRLSSIKHIKNGDAALKANLWVEAIRAYKKGSQNDSQEIPSELFMKRLSSMREQNEMRYKEASDIAQEVDTQYDPSQLARALRQMDSYLLKSRKQRTRDMAPMPPELRELITSLVELEVKERLSKLRPSSKHLSSPQKSTSPNN